MDFQEKNYVIGVDLGTTNSAVSYVDLSIFEAEKNENKEKKGFIKRFNVSQLTGAGEFSRVPVLPSFLYIPGPYDVSGEALRHPWKKEADLFAGVFARDHGAKIPARLVSSAKSWLCHARADRTAKILPWGSEGVEKVSPVEATSQYLGHIKKAWNHSVKDEDLFFENQFVVITVPASFDEAAREYTIEAAKNAGLKSANITLIEEPLSAFYSWLVRHETRWHQQVRPGDLILVCDVGGGTSDFTLITLQESEGSPRFERLAVGDHLILGGDNVDLALANLVESKFKNREKLGPDKWKILSYKCREAKEKILDGEEEKVRITLKGEGRSLIAGTMAADLTREDLDTVLGNGFFPDVTPETDVPKKRGKAIAEFGLPYEQEPAITRHIGWFLEKHREDVKAALDKEPMPDFILFNGGSLKPSFLQERIRSAIRSWFRCDNENLPKILDNPLPDLSVALGASYYGLVKHGAGVRVGSGSPRSYYLGIATSSAKKENGGKENATKAVCIVERGLDEGSAITLPDMAFEVLTNQPVSFELFSSSFRSGDRSGDVVAIDDSLTTMDPMHTIVRFGKKGEKQSIPVTIEPEYTEMGTLALWCRSGVSSHRWKLQFQLRDQPGKAQALDSEVFDDALVHQAVQLIEEALDRDSDASEIITLAKRVEKIVEKPKNSWPLSLLRSMADCLIKNAQARNVSAEHEVRWLNLTGFCIRPGFGDAFDEERMRHLWKIYLKGLCFPKAKQNAAEWWIFVRRIAAGLKAGQQRQVFQDISAYLLPGKKAGQNKVSPQEMTEIWMAAANLERLLVKDKVALGRALFPRLKAAKTSRQLLWALSRIGARELLYGSVDRVVAPREAAGWIHKLLKENWKEKEAAAGAAAQMARKTGDRTRDLEPEVVEKLEAWMKEQCVSQRHLKVIKEKIARDAREKSSVFGESLPQGLVLKTE
ncbi:MAG TPA: Hsp70 family protein [Desulfobacteraceae bacterium]|nr:Hsp70 family protein [Desulfobacteraceae bacterium]